MVGPVVDAFNRLIDAKFVDTNGVRWSQEKIGEAMAVDGLIGKMSQSLVSDILAGKKIGPQFLVALSHHTGKTINELLGPTAPQPAAQQPGGATSLEKEAAYAALAFVEIMEQRGFAYGGIPGERYHAMRSAARAMQSSRQLEITEVTSVTIAIDKIRRASDAFAVATERTSRAARSADNAVLRLIKKAG